MDTVTKFDEEEWRIQFCHDTSHRMECVEKTIDKMLVVMAQTAEIHKINMVDAVESVYDIFNDVEKFEAALLKLLSVKECNCESKDSH